MSYTGVAPTFSLLKLDTYTLDGVATDFTLTYRVGAASAVDVYINGQFQEPNIAYSVSNKTLTLSEAPPTGKMIVRYRSIEGMTPSGEVSPDGDSVAKRTNDGRVKGATAVEIDDLINKALLEAEYTKSTDINTALSDKFDSTIGKADTATAEAGTDDTQWMSALKTQESIKANKPEQVNILAASGTAVADSINEFQSSITVSLLLADSVPANTVCSFLVQEKYKVGTKTINLQGTDTVSNEVGTDTSIVLSDGFSGRIYLISDGVSDWRF